MPTPPMHFVDLQAQYRLIQADVDARIHAVLEHGQYILGPEVAVLEQRLAARVGVRHCISCASGTDALLLALLALGVGPGDEVITSPFTFFATQAIVVNAALVTNDQAFTQVDDLPAIANWATDLLTPRPSDETCKAQPLRTTPSTHRDPEQKRSPRQAKDMPRLSKHTYCFPQADLAAQMASYGSSHAKLRNDETRICRYSDGS